MKSFVFVFVQFVLIFAIARYSSVWGGVAQNTVTLIAISLGIWAVMTMRLQVNIFPDVRNNQDLFISGPYRFVRHPMYAAVLLATLAWATNRFDAVSLSMWLILLTDLLLKLHYEEKLLINKFIAYKKYTQKTKRLVPFIY